MHKSINGWYGETTYCRVEDFTLMKIYKIITLQPSFY